MYVVGDPDHFRHDTHAVGSPKFLEHHRVIRTESSAHSLPRKADVEKNVISSNNVQNKVQYGSRRVFFNKRKLHFVVSSLTHPVTLSFRHSSSLERYSRRHLTVSPACVHCDWRRGCSDVRLCSHVSSLLPPACTLSFAPSRVEASDEFAQLRQPLAKRCQRGVGAEVPKTGGSHQPSYPKTGRKFCRR